jgi:hypothetical protein
MRRGSISILKLDSIDVVRNSKKHLESGVGRFDMFIWVREASTCRLRR